MSVVVLSTNNILAQCEAQRQEESGISPTDILSIPNLLGIIGFGLIGSLDSLLLNFKADH